MPTSQPDNLLQFAKQGNSKAIGALLNRQLQPKGMLVKTSIKDGCLQIMIESIEAPEQQALVAFIRKGLTSLGTQSIERVKVYGRQQGDEFPAWSSEFELVPSEMISDNGLSLSTHLGKNHSAPIPHSTHNLGMTEIENRQPNLSPESVSSNLEASSPRKIQIYSSPRRSKSLKYLDKADGIKRWILLGSWDIKKISFSVGSVFLLVLISTFSWIAYTTAKVPSVVGQDASYARGILKGQGFEVETTEQTEDGVQPGQVLVQEPDSESREDKGSTVRLIVAKPSVYSIQGSLTLVDSDIEGTGNYCYGTGGYEDIQAAMPVTIRDAKGSIIATGTTESGVGPTDSQYYIGRCTFKFKVDNVAKSDFYEIEVGRRGKLNYSFEEMKERNWEVVLSLG